MKTINQRKASPASLSVPDCRSCPPRAPDASGYLALADAVNNASRRAHASFQRLSGSPSDAQAQLAWTDDERDVLKSRAALLAKLMAAPEDPRLCMRSAPPAGVCVTYTRLRAEGEVELGAVQSPLSWAVPGGDLPLQELLADGKATPWTLGLLLAVVQESLPRKKPGLSALREALLLPLPEGLQAVPHDRAKDTKALGGGAFRVSWGALDLDSQEPWQNPSTNAAIRASVQEAAHRANREGAWTGLNDLRVRILHNNESHTLAFAPYHSSEACAVTHVLCAQSVFSGNTQRGLLSLGADPEAVRALPGTVAPLDAYVCLRAYAGGRLNEAQLNYVHSRGVLRHGGFNPKLLPDPAKAGTTSKAVRLCVRGADVLASSYHMGDQVYTTITVARYPPFGTQFSPPLVHADEAQARERAARALLGAGEEEPGQLVVLPPPRQTERGHTPARRPRNSQPDEVQRRAILPEPPDFEETKAGYWYTRQQWVMRMNEKFRFIHKPDRWNRPLLPGQYYFVDGVFESPYNLDNRWILFDVAGKERYKRAQQTALMARNSIIQTVKSMNIPWIVNLSFYDNMKQSPVIHNIWSETWKLSINSDNNLFSTEHQQMLHDLNLSPESAHPLTFWYNYNMSAWVKLMWSFATKADKAYWEQHKSVDHTSMFGKQVIAGWYGHHLALQHWLDHGYLQSEHVAKALGRPLGPFMGVCENGLWRSTAPERRVQAPQKLAPPKARKAQSESQVPALQVRVRALEARLASAQHPRNTEHVVREALDRVGKR